MLIENSIGIFVFKSSASLQQHNANTVDKRYCKLAIDLIVLKACHTLPKLLQSNDKLRFLCIYLKIQPFASYR